VFSVPQPKTAIKEAAKNSFFIGANVV